MLTLNQIPGPFGRAAIECDNKNRHLNNDNFNNNNVDVVDNELKTVILSLIINERRSMADAEAVQDNEEELFNFKSLLNHKMSINNQNNNYGYYYFNNGKLNDDLNNGSVQYRSHSMIHKHFSFVSYPQR